MVTVFSSKFQREEGTLFSEASRGFSRLFEALRGSSKLLDKRKSMISLSTVVGASSPQGRGSLALSY